MRSVGFDSLVPSAGSMTRNDTRSDRSRLRLPRNTDFFAFLCPLLTPRSQHLCQRLGLPLGVAGWSAPPHFFPSRRRLRQVAQLRHRAGIQFREALMTPDSVPHDTHAAEGQAREARRKRLIFAVVAAAG